MISCVLWTQSLQCFYWHLLHLLSSINTKLHQTNFSRCLITLMLVHLFSLWIRKVIRVLIDRNKKKKHQMAISMYVSQNTEKWNTSIIGAKCQLKIDRHKLRWFSSFLQTRGVEWSNGCLQTEDFQWSFAMDNLLRCSPDVTIPDLHYLICSNNLYKTSCIF